MQVHRPLPVVVILGLSSLVACGESEAGDSAMDSASGGSASGATASGGAASDSGGGGGFRASGGSESIGSTGGKNGSGGEDGLPGTGGTKGDSGSGGTSDGGAGGATGAGSFTISARLASEDNSDAPTTVGLVDWSTTAGTPTEATIQFGLTTDYGMEAPVDVTEPELRGVLLGMKQGRTYHFRIVVTVNEQEIRSADHTIETGALPERTLVEDFDILSESDRERGYILTSFWDMGPEGFSAMAFILDQDGDVVWWYGPELKQGVAKAALSADGRDVWMVSPSLTGGEPLARVGLDGLGPESYQSTRGNHDIIPVRGDVMAFVNYGVWEIDRAGQEKEILNLDDLPPVDPSAPLSYHHPNALDYNQERDEYLLSARFSGVYSFPRAGATSENITDLSTILGPNTGWGANQHQIEVLDSGRFLMFANRVKDDPPESAVLEFDLSDGSEVWRYEGGEYSENFGGVQRLPGGNTLVTFSNAGVIHEVTPNGEKVLEVTCPYKLGYSTWLPSLYRDTDE